MKEPSTNGTYKKYVPPLTVKFNIEEPSILAGTTPPPENIKLELQEETENDTMIEADSKAVSLWNEDE